MDWKSILGNRKRIIKNFMHLSQTINISTKYVRLQQSIIHRNGIL